MKTGWAIVFGVLCGFLGAGIILVTSSTPRGEPVKLLPPPTAPPIVVHVSGAVSEPGVYTLPPDCRVQAALDAAGGPLPEANVGEINLAAFIQDGSQLWIPFQASGQSRMASPTSNATPPENKYIKPVQAVPGELININTATQSELESLPGIGPVTAERIIAYREDNGPFASIEDIDKVPGIGPAKFDQVKDLITVGRYP
jgi:competence protein ComEA